MPPKNNLKVVLVGDSGVGKSTILSRFRGERFNPCYVQTRAREIKNVQVQLNKGKTVELQVWDTPGADQCRTMTAAYVREDVKGVIVVFDVTNDESYFNVQHWVRTVKEYTGDDLTSVVFVGNKADKGRKVRQESGNQLAEQYSGAYFETSAKTNQNINKVFVSIAKSLTRSSNEDRVPAVDVSSRIEENTGNRGMCTIL